MKQWYYFTILFAMWIMLSGEITYGKEEIKIEYYPDGSIKAELRYENGVLNGISRKYDEEGNLSEIEYRNGVRHGMSRHYFGSTTDHIRREVMFEHDKANGPFREYYRNGTLKTEHQRIDGKPEGESKDYYENGALFVVKNYKNGKIDGVAQMYYDTGELMKTMSFKNGILDGQTTVRYKSQKIKEELMYKNGKCIKRRCFSEQGKRITCAD
ncbi:MAG: toxin-antitoxin system YwqK family antitoxin [Desulfobacterota bacterium]|nr:toxin-antitoxin system YwqK family antitoxin [Thermodesulfobacteriota bacterium]